MRKKYILACLSLLGVVFFLLIYSNVFGAIICVSAFYITLIRGVEKKEKITEEDIFVLIALIAISSMGITYYLGYSGLTGPLLIPLAFSAGLLSLTDKSLGC